MRNKKILIHSKLTAVWEMMSHQGKFKFRRACKKIVEFKIKVLTCLGDSEKNRKSSKSMIQIP